MKTKVPHNGKGRKTANTTKGPDWHEALDRFTAHLATAKRSPHTLNHYREDLAAFARWWKEHSHQNDPLAPQAISEFDLSAWQDYLADEPIAPRRDGKPDPRTGKKRKPAAVNAKVAALRSFLRWADRTGIIHDLPESPPRRKTGRRLVRWLDKRQRHQLLRRASHNKRDLAVILVLIETGLRVAELVALRWCDLKLGERKGWLSVRAGKGRKPRGIPLSRDALKTFREMHSAGIDEFDPVFTGQRGPLTVRGVQDLLLKYEDPRVGLENLTPHMLRHTFAIVLRDRGVPWPTIAALMGHESVKTTMDNYAVASERDMEQAVGADIDEED